MIGSEEYVRCFVLKDFLIRRWERDQVKRLVNEEFSEHLKIINKEHDKNENLSRTQLQRHPYQR